MVLRETDTQATPFQIWRHYIAQGLDCRIDSPAQHVQFRRAGGAWQDGGFVHEYALEGIQVIAPTMAG
jgi:hypothetical protein